MVEPKTDVNQGTLDMLRSGRARLETDTADWKRRAAAVARMLTAES